MKRILTMGAAALIIAAGTTSCEDPVNNGYEGTNYIYLSSDNTSMYGVPGESITVNVMLTTALENDAEITFAVENGDGIVELSGNPVTIPAGSTKASFEIACVDDISISETSTFSVVLDESAANPEGMSIREHFSFSIIALANTELTPEQAEIIGAYYEATGIDLSKYIGLINVSVSYTSIDPDTEEPISKTIEGRTEITLSEASELGKPVFKMTANAMGLQDEFYDILRACTVESEYWYLDATDEVKEEYGVECYSILCDGIGWSASSEEVFTMALDNITFNEDKTVSFLGTKLTDPEDPESEITVVPFDFTFSAYEREKEAIANGTLTPDETWMYDCTADPDAIFNYSDITEDTYESYGTWIAPSASVSDEKLEFVFSTDYSLAYDYMRVVATYTPAAE